MNFGKLLENARNQQDKLIEEKIDKLRTELKEYIDQELRKKWKNVLDGMIEQVYIVMKNVQKMKIINAFSNL